MKATFKYFIALTIGSFFLASITQSVFAKINPSLNKGNADLPLNSIIPLPPVKSVTVLQNISFGLFSSGPQGGSVSITSGGIRSATGTVFLFSTNTGNEGIFRVVYGAGKGSGTITIGTIVNLTNGTGGIMTLTINDYNPIPPFQVPKGKNPTVDVKVGGSLSVPANAIRGIYNGTFELIFNEQ